jgi:hypothetical protein
MVCYSLGMETMNAPDLSPGYPSRGERLGPAWAEVFTILASNPGEWVDGTALWTEVAERHNLEAVTLRGLMFRMATAGHLEREARQVQTERGKRARTHFRYVKKEV